MAEHETKIQWTWVPGYTGATWNPTTGCSHVSDGCVNCYAESLATGRLKGTPGYPGLPWTKANADVNVVLHPDRLDQTLRWKKPRAIFVNSMSDQFHEKVPDKWIKDVWALMAQRPDHIFQILTKRPERMATLCENLHLLPNVWLGTSVENDKVISRIDHLRKVPAKIRFLSLEPLIGPLKNLNLDGIHWVIVGGESGPNHRPIEKDWVKDIRDQCLAAGIPFFFKQWGGKTPKVGGKKLDGREWQEFPIDMSLYGKGGKLTERQLDKLAIKIKDYIIQGETGRCVAYIAAGEELAKAKVAVRKNKGKWIEWLAEQDIPRRTASRAMRYAKKPDKYKEDRIKDALAKKEKRQVENGPAVGPKQILLKAIRGATDAEVETICDLIARSNSLTRLRDIIA